jgi:hypothetical protein
MTYRLGEASTATSAAGRQDQVRVEINAQMRPTVNCVNTGTTILDSQSMKTEG